MSSGYSAWTIGARVYWDSGTEKIPTLNQGHRLTADTETESVASGTGIHDLLTRSRRVYICISVVFQLYLSSQETSLADLKGLSSRWERRELPHCRHRKDWPVRCLLRAQPVHRVPLPD